MLKFKITNVVLPNILLPSTSNICLCKHPSGSAGEMIQWFKTMTVLLEDWRSVPRTPMTADKQIVILFSGDPMAPSCFGGWWRWGTSQNWLRPHMYTAQCTVRLCCVLCWKWMRDCSCYMSTLLLIGPPALGWPAQLRLYQRYDSFL